MTVEEKIEEILKKKGKLNQTSKFSWKEHSAYVAIYCIEHLDPKKYNWKKSSWAIAQYGTEYFDPKKYNWEEDSHYIAEFCPNKIDPKLYNWEGDSCTLLFFHPNHKHLKYCIWNKKTIESLKVFIAYYKSIWRKYENQIDDLLDLTKRETLLKKIAKEITISKI